ncbi:MAG TPA: indole-3-glycerol phosphate synthase TrpC, partial [Blastocatellia bacterium]
LATRRFKGIKSSRAALVILKNMRLTDIQARILEAKRMRLAHLRARPLEALREQSLGERENAFPHLLRDAVSRPDRLNVIAEIKRASPWQAVIQTEIDPAELALAHSRGGAAAISVWTEEDYFHGSLDDLRVTRAAVSLPVLRKDFIIEPCQVYETAIAGADALVLIVAALDERRLALLRRVAEEELGLDAFVEVRSANEMRRAHAIGATLIGVNNRDPSTFEVSLDISVEVARAAPEGVILVSQDGLRTRKHLLGLRALGYKGFLIGESAAAGDLLTES